MMLKNFATLAVSSAYLFVSTEAYLNTNEIIAAEVEKAAAELANGKVPETALLSGLGAQLNAEREQGPKAFTWGFDETKFALMSIKGGPFNADGFHKETGQTGLAYYKTHLTPLIEAVVGFDSDADNADNNADLIQELEDELEDADEEESESLLAEISDLEESTAALSLEDPCPRYETYTNEELVGLELHYDDTWADLDCDEDGISNAVELAAWQNGEKWDPYVKQMANEEVILSVEFSPPTAVVRSSDNYNADELVDSLIDATSLERENVKSAVVNYNENNDIYSLVITMVSDVELNDAVSISNEISQLSEFSEKLEIGSVSYELSYEVVIDYTSQVYNWMISLVGHMTPAQYFETCEQKFLEGVDYEVEYQTSNEGDNSGNTTMIVSSYFGTSNSMVATVDAAQCTGDIVAHSAILQEKVAELVDSE